MDQSFSIALLPFLKTSGPVRLGDVVFRSTQDLESLPPGQQAAVRDAAAMLYLQDDLRIRAASFAIVPFVDQDRTPHATEALEHIQAVIAYLYASPHQVFGGPFLHAEHASLVLLSPTRVLSTLVCSRYNVISGVASEGEDQGRHVDGFAGLYNFSHHFWVTAGSRIYGPMPHPTLNISQDLKEDVERVSSAPGYRHLLDLLRRPRSAAAARYLTALRWYTSAHRESTDDWAALVHLSIAFEALLGLPQPDKTDRLVDAISLVLGRVPRLDEWAKQFYQARSQIVHEGRTESLRFLVGGGTSKAEGQQYQTLFAYGAQIFRLCLGTLLVGRDLADRAGLERRFVTNQERYTQLCQVLDLSASISDRLARADEIVDAIDEMHFVEETGLRLGTMVGAVRRAGQLVLDLNGIPDSALREGIARLTNAERTPDHFEELGAILALDDLMPNTRQEDREIEVLRRLVRCVTGSTFMHYYWLKRTRDDARPVE